MVTSLRVYRSEVRTGTVRAFFGGGVMSVSGSGSTGRCLSGLGSCLGSGRGCLGEISRGIVGLCGGCRR